MVRLPYKKVRSKIDRRSGDSRRDRPDGIPATAPDGPRSFGNDARHGCADRRTGGEKRREWKRVSRWSSKPAVDYKY